MVGKSNLFFRSPAKQCAVVCPRPAVRRAPLVFNLLRVYKKSIASDAVPTPLMEVFKALHQQRLQSQKLVQESAKCIAQTKKQVGESYELLMRSENSLRRLQNAYASYSSRCVFEQIFHVGTRPAVPTARVKAFHANSAIVIMRPGLIR